MMFLPFSKKAFDLIDVEQSEGHLGIREVIKGCVPDSMQSWPSLLWRDHRLIGNQDEGASGCVKEGH